MAYGLEIRNASGNLSLSVTSRLLRFISSGAFGSIPARGSMNISVPGLVQDGSYLAYTTTNDIIGVVTNGNIALLNTSWIIASSGTYYLCAC